MGGLHYSKAVKKGEKDDAEEIFFRSRRLVEALASTRPGLMGYFGIQRGSPIFGVGLNPVQKHGLAHEGLSAECSHLIRDLMEDTRFRMEGVVGIMDTVSIFNALRCSKLPHPVSFITAERPRDWLKDLGVELDSKDGSQLDKLDQFFDFNLKLDKERAANEGVKLKILVQSMFEEYVSQHYARLRQESGLTDKRIYPPTVQLSDMLIHGCIPGAENANQRVMTIFSKLFDLIESEDGKGDELAAAIWESIPYPIRREHFVGKAGRTYRGLRKNELKKEARELMGYVLMQIALMLYWGGVKYGYEGEKPFDEATELARRNFANELDLDEMSRHGSYVYIPSSRGIKVPYCVHNFEQQDGVLARPPFPVIGFLASSPEGSLEYRLEWIMTNSLPIIERDLKRTAIPSDVPQPNEPSPGGDVFMKIRLFNRLRELVSELNSDPELAAVLQASGINEVIFGQVRIFDLKKLNTLPIQAKDLDAAVDRQIMLRLYRRTYKKLKTLTDDHLTIENITGALWQGGESIIVFDRLNYARLTRNDQAIMPKHRPESPREYQWVYIFGYEEVDKEGYFEQLLEATKDIPPEWLISMLIAHFENLIKQIEAEDQTFFEDKEAYLIRYMAEVLSGPASRRPKLASQLTELFRRLSKILLPDRDLQISLSNSAWSYDGWKAS